jgi:Cys-rich repeat protein
MMLRCNLDAGTCVECAASPDCPMKQVCRPADGMCVACLASSDCPGGQACDGANRCVPASCEADAGDDAAAPGPG